MGIGGGDVDKPLELALAKAWAWATAEIQKRRTGVAENYQERGQGKRDNGGCKANKKGKSGVAEILREKVE